MAKVKQIASARLPRKIISSVERMAAGERRTVSAMLSILIEEALQARLSGSNSLENRVSVGQTPDAA